MTTKERKHHQRRQFWIDTVPIDESVALPKKKHGLALMFLGDHNRIQSVYCYLLLRAVSLPLVLGIKNTWSVRLLEAFLQTQCHYCQQFLAFVADIITDVSSSLLFASYFSWRIFSSGCW